MEVLLTKGPIRKHLLKMAIPMSVGLFFNTMFKVVDTFYAGQQNRSKVDRLTINGLILTVAVSLVLTLAGVLYAPKLLVLLGAQGEAYVEGARYIQGIYAGALFFGINATLSAFLSSRGMTKPYRNFLVVGFFLNLILDPLLIFGWLGLPKLGTMGVRLPPSSSICSAISISAIKSKNSWPSSDPFIL
jgi:Na+-driven multidrug efflux pump